MVDSVSMEGTQYYVYLKQLYRGLNQFVINKTIMMSNLK